MLIFASDNIFLRTFFFKRERGKETERACSGETSTCCSTHSCINWSILAYALTRYRTRNPGALGRHSNQLSYSASAR